MRLLTDSSLEVSTHHLVRNFTASYARRWHRISGATCTATYISGQPIISSGKKKKGAISGNPPFFKEHPPSRGGKRSRGKKTDPSSPAKGTDLESYFAYIGVDVKELTVEVPPLQEEEGRARK